MIVLKPSSKNIKETIFNFGVREKTEMRGAPVLSVTAGTVW